MSSEIHWSDDDYLASDLAARADNTISDDQNSLESDDASAVVTIMARSGRKPTKSPVEESSGGSNSSIALAPDIFITPLRPRTDEHQLGLITGFKKRETDFYSHSSSQTEYVRILVNPSSLLNAGTQTLSNEEPSPDASKAMITGDDLVRSQGTAQYRWTDQAVIFSQSVVRSKSPFKQEAKATQVGMKLCDGFSRYYSVSSSYLADLYPIPERYSDEVDKDEVAVQADPEPLVSSSVQTEQRNRSFQEIITTPFMQPLQLSSDERDVPTEDAIVQFDFMHERRRTVMSQVSNDCCEKCERQTSDFVPKGSSPLEPSITHEEKGINVYMFDPPLLSETESKCSTPVITSVLANASKSVQIGEPSRTTGIQAVPIQQNSGVQAINESREHGTQHFYLSACMAIQTDAIDPTRCYHSSHTQVFLFTANHEAQTDEVVCDVFDVGFQKDRNSTLNGQISSLSHGDSRQETIQADIDLCSSVGMESFLETVTPSLPQYSTNVANTASQFPQKIVGGVSSVRTVAVECLLLKDEATLTVSPVEKRESMTQIGVVQQESAAQAQPNSISSSLVAMKHINVGHMLKYATIGNQTEVPNFDMNFDDTNTDSTCMAFVPDLPKDDPVIQLANSCSYFTTIYGEEGIQTTGASQRFPNLQNSATQVLVELMNKVTQVRAHKVTNVGTQQSLSTDDEGIFSGRQSRSVLTQIGTLNKNFQSQTRVNVQAVATNVLLRLPSVTVANQTNLSDEFNQMTPPPSVMENGYVMPSMQQANPPQMLLPFEPPLMFASQQTGPTTPKQHVRDGKPFQFNPQARDSGYPWSPEYDISSPVRHFRLVDKSRNKKIVQHNYH